MNKRDKKARAAMRNAERAKSNLNEPKTRITEDGQKILHANESYMQRSMAASDTMLLVSDTLSRCTCMEDLEGTPVARLGDLITESRLDEICTNFTRKFAPYGEYQRAFGCAKDAVFYTCKVKCHAMLNLSCDFMDKMLANADK